MFDENLQKVNFQKKKKNLIIDNSECTVLTRRTYGTVYVRQRVISDWKESALPDKGLER